MQYYLPHIRVVLEMTPDSSQIGLTHAELIIKYCIKLF